MRIINHISEWTGRIAVWALVIVTGIVVYEVITRRVFHSPHVWTYEIITIFYGFHFMILAAYTLLHQGHVSVDIFYSRLPVRKRAILDVITYLVFFFPFVVIIFKVGLTNAIASWLTYEKTLTARLPLVMPAMKTITPVTAALLFIQGFSQFYQRLFFLIKGKDLLAPFLEERLIYDPKKNLFFVNFEGYAVKTGADIEKIRLMVEKILSPLDKKVYVFVNYNNFTILPDILDRYSEMVRCLAERYYLKVTRYTANPFLREELREAFERQGVLPEIYETGEEAREALIKK